MPGKGRGSKKRKTGSASSKGAGSKSSKKDIGQKYGDGETSGDTDLFAPISANQNVSESNKNTTALNQIRQATTAVIYNEDGGTVTMNVSDSTFNTTGHETRQSSIPGQTHTELCRLVNEDTKEKTSSVKITECYTDDKISEPTCEVYPQMIKVKNYFKGGYERLEEAEIEVYGTTSEVWKNQIRRERGFYYQEHGSEDETITAEDLLASITQKANLDSGKRINTTAIVASAGSGKSTLLRRIALKTVKCCPKSHGGDADKEEKTNIKMVRYIELKDMKYVKNVKPSKFLFGGFYSNESDEEKIYKWLLDHQSEAILYFDGLDQAIWSVNDNTNKRKIQRFEEATTEEIMYNLLSRYLLPQVRIVIASREFKISELPQESRPRNIISLAGLSRADAKSVFVELLQPDGAEIWSKLTQSSPRLSNLVSIPVFLIFTAVLIANEPNKPPPTTVTELYNRILLSFKRLETVNVREKIPMVIKKLKAMAYQGMREGRVVFYDSDMKTHNLSIQDSKDLILKVPRNNLVSTCLLEGDFVYFFCHQSFQEFLAASFVAEMDRDEFKQFNDNDLHESRWSVVRMFVSGIIYSEPILDESGTPLHGVSDVEWKQTLFGDSIRPSVGKEIFDSLEQLSAIYESNNDELITSLPCLPDLHAHYLGPGDAFMFASLLGRRRGKERKVKLRGCRINDDLVDIMIQNWKDEKIRVEELDLRSNRFTKSGLKSILTHFVVDIIRVDSDLMEEYCYEDFNWNTIRKIEWDPEITLINDEETITIEGRVKGRYIKTLIDSHTEKQLSLYVWEGDRVKFVIDVIQFFQQKSFEVTIMEQVYLTPDILIRMKSMELKGEIPQMVVNCKSKKNVDVSSIDFCIQNLRTTHVDIVVDDETSFDPCDFPRDIGSHVEMNSVNIKVHWCFEAYTSKHVTNVVQVVQRNHVENLRLDINDVYHTTTPEEVWTVIRNCSELKKVTLVYRFYESCENEERNMINHTTIIKRLAEGIEVEVLKYVELSRIWKQIMRELSMIMNK